MSASTSFDASISGSAAAADAATPPPSSPSSSTDAAAAAAARREARKARILGKGSDRLAKLTKQARGDEAEMLYPSTPPPAAAAAAASPAQSKSALTTTAATGEEDPEEIDISNQARMDDEMQRAMQMFQQRQQQQQQQGQQGQGSPMPQDPFAQMMAALTGGGGAMGGGPPGQDGMNGGGMPDLSQLFAAMQQQQPGAGGNGAGVPPGFPGAPAAKVSPASWLSTRLFSLLHTLVFLALGYFAIASALGGGTSTPASTQADEFGVDDAAASAVLGTGHNEASQRLHSWASLAYYRPSTASSGLSSGLQSRHFDIDGASLGVKGALPLFHLFLLIEVLLQSVRFLFSSPLSSHPQSQQQMAGGSPLSMLLQFLPPPIRFAVVTGKRWLSLLGTCVDDIAVLVFALGCGTIWCAAQVKA